MKRRSFLRGAIGALATVAIATKMAPKFPKFEHTTHEMGYRIAREDLENQLMTPGEIGQRMAESLARSMRETREQVATRVFWDQETDFLHVEGISREEMYRD